MYAYGVLLQLDTKCNYATMENNGKRSRANT